MKLQINMRKVFIFNLLLALLIILGIIGYFSKETNVVSDNQQIEIEGPYGETFNLNEIVWVNLSDTLPVLKIRTNGYALGPVKIGYFRTEDNQKVKLFIHSPKGPFLEIKKNNSYSIFVNYKNPEQTKQVYDEIIMLTK